MAMRSVGFQLRTDGKAEVKNDFAEVRKAGQDAMSGVAEAAEQAADRAAKATDAYTERQMDSYRRQAAAAKLAAAAAESRASFDGVVSDRGNGGQFATVNYDRSAGAAKQSAGVFQAEADRADALAKIRAMLDPLSVAQARYDSELEQYNRLLGPTGLNEREHAAAVAMSTERLNEARQALDAHSQSTGFNRVQTMMLRSAAFNASSSIAAGMPIYRVLIEQGLEVAQALGMGDESAAAGMQKMGAASQAGGEAVKEGAEKSSAALDTLKEKGKEAADSMIEEHGVAGALGKVRQFLTPTRLAVGATAAAVAIGAKSWLDYSNAVAKLRTIGEGVGRSVGMSADELEATAEAAAKAGHMTVGAARDIEAGYVKAGNASSEVMQRLIAITEDFAAATGTEAPDAVSKLDAAMADPIKGAQELAENYGWVNQSTAEYIAKLVEQNDEAGAQRVLIDAVAQATAGAADKANLLAQGWDNIKIAAAGAWTWLGKAIDRAAGGGAVADQIAALQRQRASGPTVGQMLMGTSTAAHQADIDRQIATLRQSQRIQQVLADRAGANKAQAEGASIVGRYQGDERDGYRTTAGKLRAALATDMPPDQRRDLQSALDAYSHAIDTFIPRQEKANRLAEIDAKIAAAKTPASKALLAAEKARVELSGQVITAADAEAQANARGDRARASTRVSRDRHAEALARDAESMEVSARAALGVAAAYLKSSAAGVEAEARRKAATDATKRGIDVDAQVRRQLNLQVSEGVANSAKTIAGLREETAARRAANDNVAAGKIAAAQLNDTLSDEAALRPLVAMQIVAQAQGQTKAYEEITHAIAAYRQALADAHTEEARSAGAAAVDATTRRTAETVAGIIDLSKSPLQQAMAAARRAANKEADEKRYSDTDRAALIEARVGEARATNAQAMARFILDASRSQADQLELSQRELELAGVSDQVRARELEKLRVEQEIRHQFPEMEQQDIDARMRGIDAQDAINTKLKVTAAAMNELRGYGAEFVDNVLSPQAWSDWETLGKSATSSIRNEFIKLALLNPIKNLLNGNKDLPTLGSVFGNIGKLFGSASAFRPDVDVSSWGDAGTIPIGRNASGTQRWSGGLTWVNENGGEIADLPDGTRIYPAAETRRMLAGNENSRSAPVYKFDLRGAVVTQDLLDQMNDLANGAAVRGAAGGAALSEAEGDARAQRKLGRW